MTDKTIKSVKQITIDELAIMVQHGFEEMGKRFDRFERRFNKIEGIVLLDHCPRIKNIEDDLGIQTERT